MIRNKKVVFLSSREYRESLISQPKIFRILAAQIGMTPETNPGLGKIVIISSFVIHFFSPSLKQVKECSKISHIVIYIQYHIMEFSKVLIKVLMNVNHLQFHWQSLFNHMLLFYT